MFIVRYTGMLHTSIAAPTWRDSISAFKSEVTERPLFETDSSQLGRRQLIRSRSFCTADQHTCECLVYNHYYQLIENHTLSYGIQDKLSLVALLASTQCIPHCTVSVCSIYYPSAVAHSLAHILTLWPLFVSLTHSRGAQ